MSFFLKKTRPRAKPDLDRYFFLFKKRGYVQADLVDPPTRTKSQIKQKTKQKELKLLTKPRM